MKHLYEENAKSLQPRAAVLAFFAGFALHTLVISKPGVVDYVQLYAIDAAHSQETESNICQESTGCIISECFYPNSKENLAMKAEKANIKGSAIVPQLGDLTISLMAIALQALLYVGNTYSA
ncbi:hypothetical protein EGR_01145 [Echinococcus granulosus]|uniref:Uncharacterized protein n=1 Tax=Echinococcus granulosus TaxID=6210 RepID=W6UZQ6_ECHGR|nr:hypothetical protein EGR_01145 [Echinococcus granulosus]EUB64017.1 hypothetical protein EGR_01145 [Echinococcus granulosus]